MNKLKSFIKQLEKFYNPLSKQVKTKCILQKSVQVNDEEIIDTFFGYSRVIPIQLANMTVTKNVFKAEIAPIPTSTSIIAVV